MEALQSISSGFNAFNASSLIPQAELQGEDLYTGYDLSQHNLLERAWASWYIWWGNPVIATGVMSFLMHEVIYFGRSIPWIIIDHIPYFRKWKLQPHKVPSDWDQWRCTYLVLLQHFTIELPQIWGFHPLAEFFGMQTYQLPFPSLWTMAKQIAIFFVFEDTWHFVFHRALHWGPLYKRIHKQHHEFSAPFGLAAEYAHPVEVGLTGFGTVGAPILYAAFIGEIHIVAVYVWIACRLFQAIDSHSGYHFPWSLCNFLPIWAGAEHHDYHHEKFTECYASSFRHWDWLFGTDKKYHAYRAKQAAAKRDKKAHVSCSPTIMSLAANRTRRKTAATELPTERNGDIGATPTSTKKPKDKQRRAKAKRISMHDVDLSGFASSSPAPTQLRKSIVEQRVPISTLAQRAKILKTLSQDVLSQVLDPITRTNDISVLKTWQTYQTFKHNTFTENNFISVSQVLSGQRPSSDTARAITQGVRMSNITTFAAIVQQQQTTIETGGAISPAVDLKEAWAAFLGHVVPTDYKLRKIHMDYQIDLATQVYNINQLKVQHMQRIRPVSAMVQTEAVKEAVQELFNWKGTVWNNRVDASRLSTQLQAHFEKLAKERMMVLRIPVDRLDHEFPYEKFKGNVMNFVQQVWDDIYNDANHTTDRTIFEDDRSTGLERSSQQNLSQVQQKTPKQSQMQTPRRKATLQKTSQTGTRKSPRQISQQLEQSPQQIQQQRHFSPQQFQQTLQQTSLSNLQTPGTPPMPQLSPTHVDRSLQQEIDLINLDVDKHTDTVNDSIFGEHFDQTIPSFSNIFDEPPQGESTLYLQSTPDRRRQQGSVRLEDRSRSPISGRDIDLDQLLNHQHHISSDAFINASNVFTQSEASANANANANVNTSQETAHRHLRSARDSVVRSMADHIPPSSQDQQGMRSSLLPPSNQKEKEKEIRLRASLQNESATDFNGVALSFRRRSPVVEAREQASADVPMNIDNGTPTDESLRSREGATEKHEETNRLGQEAESIRLKEEEANRLRQEARAKEQQEAEARKQQEDEAVRHRQEAEARRLQEEDDTRKKLDEEEENRKRLEEESDKRRLDEETNIRLEDEHRRKFEAENRERQEEQTRKRQKEAEQQHLTNERAEAAAEKERQSLASDSALEVERLHREEQARNMLLAQKSQSDRIPSALTPSEGPERLSQQISEQLPQSPRQTSEELYQGISQQLYQTMSHDPQSAWISNYSAPLEVFEEPQQQSSQHPTQQTSQEPDEQLYQQLDQQLSHQMSNQLSSVQPFQQPTQSTEPTQRSPRSPQTQPTQQFQPSPQNKPVQQTPQTQQSPSTSSTHPYNTAQPVKANSTSVDVNEEETVDNNVKEIMKEPFVAQPQRRVEDDLLNHLDLLPDHSDNDKVDDANDVDSDNHSFSRQESVISWAGDDEEQVNSRRSADGGSRIIHRKGVRVSREVESHRRTTRENRQKAFDSDDSDEDGPPGNQQSLVPPHPLDVDMGDQDEDDLELMSSQLEIKVLEIPSSMVEINKDVIVLSSDDEDEDEGNQGGSKMPPQTVNLRTRTSASSHSGTPPPNQPSQQRNSSLFDSNQFQQIHISLPLTHLTPPPTPHIPRSRSSGPTANRVYDTINRERFRRTDDNGYYQDENQIGEERVESDKLSQSDDEWNMDDEVPEKRLRMSNKARNLRRSNLGMIDEAKRMQNKRHRHHLRQAKPRDLLPNGRRIKRKTRPYEEELIIRYMVNRYRLERWKFNNNTAEYADVDKSQFRYVTVPYKCYAQMVIDHGYRGNFSQTLSERNNIDIKDIVRKYNERHLRNGRKLHPALRKTTGTYKANSDTDFLQDTDLEDEREKDFVSERQLAQDVIDLYPQVIDEGLNIPDRDAENTSAVVSPRLSGKRQRKGKSQNPSNVKRRRLSESGAAANTLHTTNPVQLDGQNKPSQAVQPEQLNQLEHPFFYDKNAFGYETEVPQSEDGEVDDGNMDRIERDGEEREDNDDQLHAASENGIQRLAASDANEYGQDENEIGQNIERGMLEENEIHRVPAADASQLEATDQLQLERANKDVEW
ncbi:hypothetical protein E3P91_00828 [Wallemia ichthyophaga]|nr:hypothetical protein E3P91_00828 [Wallemia ichthyophaga]